MSTENNKKPDRARDESVWFSFLCAALAFGAAVWNPSIGISLVFILMLGWFLWTLYEMSADRFS